LEGGLLDCPPNISQESWLADSLLDKIQPAPAPPACHCPPAQANRLGGCRPMLRWVGHDQLQPFCLLCSKALVAGVNRRRDQVRMIALAAMEPEHLDLEDLVDAGWLVGERPAPPEPDSAMAAMAWPTAKAEAPKGVPTAEAIVAATAALEQSDAQQAWLGEVP